MPTRRALAIGLVAALACRPATPRATVALPPPIFTVTAREYAFDAPDTIPSGPTTIRLISRGREEHFVQLMRITSPHTLDEFRRTLTAPAPAPWVTTVGGVGTLEPGGTATTTVDLAPGFYAMLCDMEDPHGRPHFLDGMVRGLVVTPDRNGATMPAADAAVDLVDYAFVLASPLPPGDHRIEVRNRGRQDHMVLVWRLHPGKSAGDVVHWMTTPSDTGPAPVTLLGGTPDVPQGDSAQLVMRLDPGRYLLICLVDDVRDHKPHFVHGMFREITVGATS